MAKYQITYSCGHTAEKQLFGPEKQRAAYREWAARSGECPACKAADAAAGIDELEKEHELPALDGSEKQVAWGRKIRAEKFRAIAEFYAGLAVKVPATHTEIFEERCALGYQLVAEKTAASWWIDNRDVGGQSMVEAAYRAAVSK